MEYLAATVSAAQSLLGALQSSELKELCSVWEYESELEKLECTMKTIKARLLDAESKQKQGELSNEAQSWVDQLKLSVYDADDLLDEFTTIAEQKAKEMKRESFGQKVRRLFSFDNPLLVALRLSQAVKEIRNKLDSIDRDYSQFGFKLDHQPIRRRREETCSYVHEPDIVGREDDQEKVVGMLLDPNVQQSVSCLSIVGIGGLGKTTLAQLVYNDPRIKENFPLRLWTCISDQDLESLDVKDTLRKILDSATGVNHEGLLLDPIVKRLRALLEGKKYLLVLDDLWNENHDKWGELVKYFMTDVRGARILVTTRSEETATIVERQCIYKLKGLSEEDSWCLFEMVAFEQRHGEEYTSKLVEIGRDIVKRCANVPLAIRVVGSLLYGQGIDEWLRLSKTELWRLKNKKNDGIGPILKFSYYHLDQPLKACFRYCALFPKDYVIYKEKLISLWMAQDYIVSKEDLSVEDVGEEYFSILLKRCFFQDVKTDEFGEIISCKIHDLMHDVAQEVSGEEVCTVKFTEGSLHNKTRHISGLGGSRSSFQFSKTKIRTCLWSGYGTRESDMDMLLRNWKCLRALDLSKSGVRSLPSELVMLLHLRYLDLSHNIELKLLPNSFSKLLKLQTLSLRDCSSLKELPEDLSKLVKLRVLDIEGCWSLSMPKGLAKLTNLVKMPLLIAGDLFRHPKRSIVSQMEELKALTNLKGSLCIKILTNAEYAKADVKEGGYIKNKEHLNCLHVGFFLSEMMKDEQSLLLEDLRPPCNLRELKLSNYGGMSMPSWAKEVDLATFPLNLVKLELRCCSGWQHLPSLRKLRNLKSLKVVNLRDLEYIEDESSKATINDGVSTSELEPSFPFLQELSLISLHKLKGWWRDDDDDIIACDINEGQQHLLTSFPSLSELIILRCPNFTCVITCPNVKHVELTGKFNEKVRIMIPIEPGNFKLRYLRVGNLGNFKSIVPTNFGSNTRGEARFPALPVMRVPRGAHRVTRFSCAGCVVIEGDKETESLSEVEEVFRSCSSLRKLWISRCWKLKSVSGGLEYLTALEQLYLTDLPSLSLSKAGEGEGENEEDDEMPWRCLGHNLRELIFIQLPKLVHLPRWMRYLTALEVLHIEGCMGLEQLSNEGEREGEGEENDGLPWRCLGNNLRELRLKNLRKLVNLPKGMRYLRALQSLTISECPALESLPESMRELTSLKRLSITHCSDSLRERCREDTGEDWPNIQHIPEKRSSLLF